MVIASPAVALGLGFASYMSSPACFACELVKAIGSDTLAYAWVLPGLWAIR